MHGNYIYINATVVYQCLHRANRLRKKLWEKHEHISIET